MQIKILEKPLKYTGRELSPHWIYKNFDLTGDAVVSFIGEADVGLSHMVDIEDVKKNEPIYSPEMLHFLFENFDPVVNLELAVTRQLLIMAEMRELLDESLRNGPNASSLRVFRRGDDLFVEKSEGPEKNHSEPSKLSVSIATASPLSALMHIGLNIRTEGVPVRACGLLELGVDPRKFQRLFLEHIQGVFDGVRKARCKVRSPE